MLAVTTATQACATLGAFALAAAAPDAAKTLGVSAALIGIHVALVYCGAAGLALFAGGIVRRYGAVRTSQASLALVAVGCALTAIGNLPAIVTGALVMGLGYGATNPAASQLLSRVATKRMNLIFSMKQTGVPIGGVFSGLIVPPVTQVANWQVAMGVCAAGIAAVGLAIGYYRRDWDSGRAPQASVLGTAGQSFGVVWNHPILRWLAWASFLYSGVQLSLMGFVATYLVAEVGLTLVVAGTVLSTMHAAGAIGRLAWGWLADRIRSGGAALVVNGVMSICGALLVAAISPAWPLPFVIAACSLFGFAALGWNGVYIAAIARRAPAGTIGLATGGSLVFTYGGVMIMPPLFAVLHDRIGLTYGTSFALMTIVTLMGIACVSKAWLARLRADPPAP